MAKKLTAKQQEKQRKEISEEIYMYVDVDSTLDGTLQEVAARILALEERIKTEVVQYKPNPESYFKFKIRASVNRDDYPEFNFSIVRMETDKEYEDRLERNKKASLAKRLSDKKKKEEAEKKELAEFARLQEKYGKKS